MFSGKENEILEAVSNECGKNPAILTAIYKTLIQEEICPIESIISAILELIGKPKSEEMVVGCLVLAKIWEWLEDPGLEAHRTNATRRIQEVSAVWARSEGSKFQTLLTQLTQMGF